MFWYYLIFGVLYILAITSFHKKNPNRTLVIMCILMTLFQGLRWNTGPDWSQFYKTFNLLNWNNVFSFSRGDYRNLEYGYALCNVIVKTIFGHYSFFLLILCGFLNFTYAFFIHRYVPKYQTMCYFMTLLCSSLFPVRNTVAGVFVLWGIKYILSKDLKKYAIIVVLSTLMHSSGVLCVIFYWFDKYINKNLLLAIYVCSSVLINYLSSIISFLASLPVLRDISLIQLMASYNDIYESYGENVNTFSIFSFIMNGAILFMVLCYRDKQMIFDKKLANILTNMTALVVIVGQMSRNANAIAELSRINYFASIGMPIMFVFAIAYYGKRFGMQVQCLALITLAYAVNRVYGLQYDYYADLFIPYYSVFENSPVRDFFTTF